MSDIKQRLIDEADLCRTEGAGDIAKLLDDAVSAIEGLANNSARYEFVRSASVGNPIWSAYVDSQESFDDAVDNAIRNRP